MDTTVEVVVNGEPIRLPEGVSVADVLRYLLAQGLLLTPGHLLEPAGDAGSAGSGGPLPTGGIAVALGDEVVPAGRWATVRVQDGDRLEILGAVAGG